MPSRIHFVDGTELVISDDPEPLVSRLKSGWAQAGVGEDRRVDINGANILYVEAYEPGVFVAEVYG